MITGEKTVFHFNCTHLNEGSSERYTIVGALAIIKCKGYGETMLGYQPTYVQQILYLGKYEGNFLILWRK